MKFGMNIETGNVALTDDMADVELARLLRDVADKLEEGGDHGQCRDYNGHEVGSWEVQW